MPRAKKAEHPTPAADAAPATDTVTLEPLPPAEKTSSDKPAYAADPNEKLTISLSNIRGGPVVHLLRSHKYKQMQIKFEHGQPDEQYLKMLTDMGWKDRTQSEGIFTRQIDPDARWQSVAKMEEEFKHVANEIRKARGLGPVREQSAA
jgi:hypothetical protein